MQRLPQQDEDEHGREVWRLLTQGFRPRTSGRKLALLRRIVQDNLSREHVKLDLLAREALIKDYESMATQPLADDAKLALLYSQAKGRLTNTTTDACG